MSPPAAEPGPPGDDAVADQLIAYLILASGAAGLEYSEKPRRITGGNETLTYAFTVQAPNETPEVLRGPLILRLFGRASDTQQGRREAAFQNALAGQNYPVPQVLITAGTLADGRPFNVMQRVDGVPLLDIDNLDPARAEPTVSRFAQIHVELHRLPAAPVIEAVASAGFPFDSFSMTGRLDYIGRYFKDDTFRDLRPVFDWLLSNRPAERQQPSVCHGDFHPGNIMVDGDRVTGVIDWPGAAFADPEFDVATSLVLIRVGAGELIPELRPLIGQLLDLYLHRYNQLAPLDIEKVNYYEVMRCFRGFTRSTALLTPGIDPALAPRDQYPWAGEFALEAGQARIAELTGVELPVPPAG